MDIIAIKEIFLKYILLPLIVLLLSIGLGLMKKQSPKVKAKVLIFYILLSGLCLAIPGFLGFSGNLYNPYWYLFSMLIYLFLGILHVNLISSYFYEPTRPSWFSMLFEILITITSMLLGCYFFYLIFNWISPFKGYAIAAASSITIFMVPLAFYYCYIQYISIPFDIYKTWQYPMNNLNVDFEKIEFRTLLMLNLELTKSMVEGKKSRINTKAPSDGISMGDWFCRVVDDYNHKYPSSTIHLLSPQQAPYSWIFYTKKSFFHFRKFIDFDKSMSENNIKDHTTIICKRVINNEIEDNKTQL